MSTKKGRRFPPWYQATSYARNPLRVETGLRTIRGADEPESAPCTSSLLISVESLSRLCRADARASDTALNRSAEPPEGAGAGASQTRRGDHPAIAFLTPLP